MIRGVARDRIGALHVRADRIGCPQRAANPARARNLRIRQNAVFLALGERVAVDRLAGGVGPATEHDTDRYDEQD